MSRPDLDQTNHIGKKVRLIFLENFPNAPFPEIAPNSVRLGLAAYRNPDHGFRFFTWNPDFASLCGPQIKIFSARELSFFDETLEGCLPADPLIRTEPVRGLQRLDLGQFFPPFFAAPSEDLSSSLGSRAGKKAVLVPAFSFGRLICSFNHARDYREVLLQYPAFCFFSPGVFLFPGVFARQETFF